MSSLSERISRDPEPWQPAEGSTIEGVVLDVDSRESEYSGSYPVLSVEDDDGTEWTIHAFHTVLAGELARKNPEPGDRIAIRFIGQQTKADGKPFFNYRVAIERAERPAVPEAPTPEVPAVPATPDPDRLHGTEDRRTPARRTVVDWAEPRPDEVPF